MIRAGQRLTPRHLEYRLVNSQASRAYLLTPCSPQWLMMLGVKHSLCLISIVSKTQPSESMHEVLEIALHVDEGTGDFGNVRHFELLYDKLRMIAQTPPKATNPPSMRTVMPWTKRLAGDDSHSTVPMALPSHRSGPWACGR